MALPLKENIIDKIPLKIFGFRPYDEAVAKELTVDLFPDPEDSNIIVTVVPSVVGLQREHSVQKAIDPAAPPQEYIKTDKTVKLPASALSRQGWEFDITRWSRADYTQIKWTEDGNRVIQSLHPMPFEIAYQLDLWTKYKSTMNQFIHRVAIKFLAREIWLKVDIGEPWGIKSIPLKLALGGPQDLTNMELDEMEDRTFRTVFSFNLDAWLFPDATSVPSIRKVLVGAGPKVIAKLPVS